MTLTLCAAALAGCGSSDRVTLSVSTIDSAGVRIVQLTGELDSASVPRLELDPGWDPVPTYEFGDLSDLDVLSDARAVMLDRLDAQVLLEEHGGAGLIRLGGPGEGPGEFAPEGLRSLVVTDSTVLVPDLFQQRLSEFGFQGELLATRAYPEQGIYAVDWRRGADGHLYVRILEPGADRIVRLQRDSLTDVTTIVTDAVEPNALMAPVALWDVAPDGIVTARSDRWVVEYREGPDQRLMWVVRGGEPSEVSEADRIHVGDLVVESAERQSGGAQMDDAARTGLLNQVTMPEVAPALAGLRRSVSGDVWIRVAAPIHEMGLEAMRVGSAEGYGSDFWHVVSADGDYRGSFLLPGGFEPTRLRSDWIYGIAEDVRGVQRPARVAYPHF